MSGRGQPSKPAKPDRTDPSDPTARTRRPEHLRPSGGYRTLRSFQVTTIIYDATVSFCERFLDPRSRTIDQMVQAARSGRQNIAEGSRASATSSQTELRLVSVARASLDELLLDDEDFLRQRRYRQWQKDDPEARAVRGLAQQQSADSTAAFGPYTPWLFHADPAVVANTAISLIHQANYLLDRQIAALERQFIEGGGYSERLAAARLEHRKQGPTESRGPTCPRCGKVMALRTARQGVRAGSQFWGCTAYPACKGVRPGSDRTDRSDGSAGP